MPAAARKSSATSATIHWNAAFPAPYAIPRRSTASAPTICKSPIILINVARVSAATLVFCQSAKFSLKRIAGPAKKRKYPKALR